MSILDQDRGSLETSLEPGRCRRRVWTRTFGPAGPPGDTSELPFRDGRSS